MNGTHPAPENRTAAANTGHGWRAGARLTALDTVLLDTEADVIEYHDVRALDTVSLSPEPEAEADPEAEAGP